MEHHQLSGHPVPEQRDKSTSPTLLPTLLWLQPNRIVGFRAVRAHCWLTSSSCHPPVPTSLFGHSYAQSFHPLVCTDCKGCHDPGAALALEFVQLDGVHLGPLLSLSRFLFTHPSIQLGPPGRARLCEGRWRQLAGRSRVAAPRPRGGPSQAGVRKAEDKRCPGDGSGGGPERDRNGTGAGRDRAVLGNGGGARSGRSR